MSLLEDLQKEAERKYWKQKIVEEKKTESKSLISRVTDSIWGTIVGAWKWLYKWVTEWANKFMNDTTENMNRKDQWKMSEFQRLAMWWLDWLEYAWGIASKTIWWAIEWGFKWATDQSERNYLWDQVAKWYEFVKPAVDKWVEFYKDSLGENARYNIWQIAEWAMWAFDIYWWAQVWKSIIKWWEVWLDVSKSIINNGMSWVKNIAKKWTNLMDGEFMNTAKSYSQWIWKNIVKGTNRLINDGAEKLMNITIKLTPKQITKYTKTVWQSPARTLLDAWIDWDVDNIYKQVSLASDNFYIDLNKSLADIAWNNFQNANLAKWLEIIYKWENRNIPWMAKKMEGVDWLIKRIWNATASLTDLNEWKRRLAKKMRIFDGSASSEEKEARRDLYHEVKNQIEDIWNQHWMDFREMNKNIMKFEWLRDPLTNTISREAKNNIFDLWDGILSVWAMSTMWPAGLALVWGKKLLQSKSFTSKASHFLNRFWDKSEQVKNTIPDLSKSIKWLWTPNTPKKWFIKNT